MREIQSSWDYPIYQPRPGEELHLVLMGETDRVFQFSEEGTGRQFAMWKTRTLESILEDVSDGTSVRIEAYTPKRFVHQIRLRVTVEGQ